MKKGILLLSALFVALFSFAGTTPAVEKVKVDTKSSSVKWVGKKVTGSHSGTINIKSGELAFDGGKLVGGTFEIDMNSMACTDLSGGMAEKLIGHLKSDDFFGTDKFGTATLVVKTATLVSGNSYDVNGDLTIKGVTQPVSFKATADKKSAVAEIKIDRTKFGVKYGSGSFFDNLGDKAIDNEFTLNVNLTTEAVAAVTTPAPAKSVAPKKTKKKAIKSAPARATKQ